MKRIFANFQKRLRKYFIHTPNPHPICDIIFFMPVGALNIFREKENAWFETFCIPTWNDPRG